MREAGKKAFRFLPLFLPATCLAACGNGGELGATLSEAAFNTLIGMGTVFVVLILISFIIWLFRFIGIAERKAAERSASKTGNGRETAEPDPGSAVPELPEEVTEAPEDDTELAAVIAAAISAFEGTDPDGIIVRSIRRVRQRKQER